MSSGEGPLLTGVPAGADIDIDEMQIPEAEAPPSPVKTILDVASLSGPRRAPKAEAGPRKALTVLKASHEGDAGQLMEALDRSPTSAVAVGMSARRVNRRAVAWQQAATSAARRIVGTRMPAPVLGAAARSSSSVERQCSPSQLGERRSARANFSSAAISILYRSSRTGLMLALGRTQASRAALKRI